MRPRRLSPRDHETDFPFQEQAKQLGQKICHLYHQRKIHENRRRSGCNDYRSGDIVVDGKKVRLHETSAETSAVREIADVGFQWCRISNCSIHGVYEIRNP